ncbi:hypothetical protein CYMTET_34304 [Cymbomonas tetramitiformis]|uniref:Uncharacterized protein n=1 Tax=Cymbomonas tetramitiformis TaxID=36881 RepID=A0AAE0FBX8_9CHLO|nr:hypothetical protein CYMTET_34304 [Cymbomonas tetramitiformis]
MALAEGGVATLMGASRRVAGLLGGVDGMGGTDEDDGGDVGRSAGGDDTRRAPQSPGAHPGSDDHLQQVARQHTASHQLPRPPGEVAGRAGTNSEQLSGRRRPGGELSATGRAWDTQATVGMGPQVETVRRDSYDASVERIAQAQVSGGCASLDEGNPVYHSQPLGTALGHSGRGVETQQQCAGRTAAEGLSDLQQHWASFLEGYSVLPSLGAQLGPMSDEYLGAAMMAPGAAARKVEESKVVMYGDVHPHQLIPVYGGAWGVWGIGPGLYGGLGPGVCGCLKRTQRRFRERRYVDANVGAEEEVDDDGGEDEDEEAALGSSMG